MTAIEQELLALLQEKRDEIVRLFAQRTREEVLSFRAFPAAQIETSAGLMLALYVQHLRAGDSAMPLEIDVLSRERAGYGVSSGDMAAVWLLFIRTAREVVLASLPDEQLRAGLAAWTELEKIGATILAWMVEKHIKNLEARR